MDHNQPAQVTEAVTALRYMTGFGNSFETEALPGALPAGRNSPQRCSYGLYAEQLSGSPFTAPRASNERSWLYRIRPSIGNWGRFRRADSRFWRSAPCLECEMAPDPLRWDPIPIPSEGVSFIEGMHTITTAGDVGAQAGMGAHVYVATRSMVREYFYNADAEMLIVPQLGRLILRTELGRIDVEPGEIAVIPRGIKFLAALDDHALGDHALGHHALGDHAARGYVCENYGGSFTLPERGPIGANCLANPRDFLTPHAEYEDMADAGTLIVKSGGALWHADIARSPLDVVAWHGNYAPYKYDLRRFSPVGPVLFDHADPSIYTVMTSPSETPGTANVDFVIFPDRWLVAENTFRPPWYHMNIMSEFMGLIYGVYDAKTGGGFVPGGFSLHNTMVPHGPDMDAFERGGAAELKPHKLEGSLAFMFETRFTQRVTGFAAEHSSRQPDYGRYADSLKTYFDASRR